MHGTFLVWVKIIYN